MRNWHKLKISQIELEKTLEFDLISTLAIELGRTFFLRQKGGRSWLITQICGLFLVSLLSLPIILIVFRNLTWVSNNNAGLMLILATAIILSLLCLLVFNYYLWRRAKQLKVLAILLNKVEKYNNLIEHLNLMAKLDAVATAQFSKTKEVGELETALSLTRDSLIKSIELEKTLDCDRHLADSRDILLANLESGLVNLDSLVQANTNDYDRLFSEAINIGLSVHREMRKNHPAEE